MGSFSLWHWLVVLVFLAMAAAAVWLLVWVILKAVNRPGAQHRPPSED